MKIVVTGGGSGGHITPILAVAHELKKHRRGVEIIYVGQRGDMLSDVPAKDPNVDSTYFISAGKLRRFHGEGLKQLLNVPMVLRNIRDVFRTLAGIWQSYWFLRRVRPDIIFVKGGFVGVPVGLAAAALHIPFVTHDSDALPGLANRIIARWAAMHAVALPEEVYKNYYPAGKTVTVGVPISRHYELVTDNLQKTFRKELGLEMYGKMLFVTGGGNGSYRLNEAVVAAAEHLLDKYPDLVIVHIAGRKLEITLRDLYKTTLTPAFFERVKVHGFVHEMYRYSGAADVSITRAGGTTMAEFAAQGKACILVPNPVLTGGHQLKNAKVLVDRHAVSLVDEKKLAADNLALMPALTDLFDHAEKRRELGRNLHTLAQTDAAERLAVVLLDTVPKH